ncbi:hypothetical protein CF319_g6087 [Tilletia indica]|uniref:AB hydrolase-1 domain-containing protein n=1 Tax=Tilletia indica TaxID=43049 RepID=A0A177TBA6_9BASI|nr:hypothetical protein CF319_g6087 [Tilletia indica]KAE8233672.1 hypothetical protein CF326_g1294 [Tilletia indica]KAE8250728.1 hypothetical protein A4X13_0g4447 [Tilletia indica]
MVRPTLVTLPPSNDPALLRPKDAPKPVQLSYSYWAPTKTEVGIAPVIVFLPSEGTDSRSIHREQLASEYLHARFNLIALDLRGCGYSTHPVPDIRSVKDVDMANVLAQDVIDALPSLPGRALERGPNGESRLFFVGTSVTSYIALRIAAKLGDLASGLILISPSSEVESPDNAQSFEEMVEAWAMTNEELVEQFPDPATLLRVSPSVKVPLLVSGGFQARLLNEQRWPAKLFAALIAHWRRRWLSAKNAYKDLETFVHFPCAKRSELGELWARITSHTLVLRGDVGQPNGNGVEEHLRSKLVNAASFACVVVGQAPLLVSVTHATLVNNEMTKFCYSVCGLSLPGEHPSAADDGLTGVSSANRSPLRGRSPVRRDEAVDHNDLGPDDAGGNRSRGESISSGVSTHSLSSTGLAPATTQASLRNIMDFNAWKELNKGHVKRMSTDASHSGSDFRARATSNVSATSFAVSCSTRSLTVSDASSYYAQVDGGQRSPGMENLPENEVLITNATHSESGDAAVASAVTMTQMRCPIEQPYGSSTLDDEEGEAETGEDVANDTEDDEGIEHGVLLRRAFGRMSTKPCAVFVPGDDADVDLFVEKTSVGQEGATRNGTTDMGGKEDMMNIEIKEEVVAYSD